MPVRARYSLADAPAKGVFYDPTMTPAEIHAHFDLQRQASREHVDVPLLVRRERLLRLRKMLDEHGPVLAAAVDKDGMDANALSGYVKNDLAPALESLEGVASVTTTGQLEESVDVTLDQDKIDALNKKIQKKIDEQFEKSQKKIDAGK